jgi:CDGSH-type Zn-finger protein
MSDAKPTPVIAQKGSYPTAVTGGKTYYWCACGRSQKQPFCDGSHKGSGIAPVAFTPEADGEVRFCGCKHSSKAPRCDGSHKAL